MVIIKISSIRNKAGIIFILLIFISSMVFAGISLGVSATGSSMQTSTISTKIIEPHYLLEWQVTYGTTGSDLGEGLTIDKDGYIYLVGTVYNTTDMMTNMFVTKYNWSDGEMLLEIEDGWTNRDEEGYSVSVDGKGNIFFAGKTSDGSLAGTTEDGVLMKYNKYGTYVIGWHTGSTTGDDAINAIEVAGDYVYIAGSRGDDLLFAQWDTDLDTANWNYILDGMDTDIGRAIGFDTGGDVYVVGETNSWDTGGGDAWILKFNSAGTKLWNVTYGTSMYDAVQGVVIDGANVLAAGRTAWYYGTTKTDILVTIHPITTPLPAGAILWRGDGEDMGYDIARDSYGNFFICGSTTSYGAGGYDAVIVKYNSKYQPQWNMTWGTNLTDNSREIAIDTRNNIYIAGTTSSYGAGGSDAFLAKFGVDSDGDGYTDDQETLAGTSPYDPADYPSAPIPGFPLGYILLAFFMILGVWSVFIKLREFPKI